MPLRLAILSSRTPPCTFVPLHSRTQQKGQAAAVLQLPPPKPQMQSGFPSGGPQRQVFVAGVEAKATFSKLAIVRELKNAFGPPLRCPVFYF